MHETSMVEFVCFLSLLEVNFMWAAHQVHHSSEYYNLSTALRQSVLQIYTSWVRYQLGKFSAFQKPVPVESFKFMLANFVDCGFFAYSWGCNFVDVSVFSFSKKENSFYICFH